MEELMPDLPAIIAAIEENLQEFEDLDDYGSITKYELAINQQIIFDTFYDICKHIASQNYQIDLLNKTVTRTYTLMNEMVEEGNLTIDQKTQILDILPADNSNMFS